MDIPKDLPAVSSCTIIGARFAYADNCEEDTQSPTSAKPLPVQISAHELAFAILIESHNAAFPLLFNVAANAVRNNYPEEWKQKICSCFSHSTKEHVKEGLEGKEILSDIFVACKIIRCRVNDVASYIGSALSDPRDKERLSLQVQGFEAARHWAFHGEFVSLEEVQSSLHLLESILTNVGCGQELSKPIEQFLHVIKDTFQEKGTRHHTLRCSVFIKTMLYRSLGEFEKEFSSFFKSKHSTEQSSTQEKLGTPRCTDHVQQLNKHILRELAKPKKQQKFKLDHKKVKEQCRHVSTIRNSFAHNKPLTQDQVVCGLTHICQLLQSFRLRSERTQSALDALQTNIVLSVDCLLDIHAMCEPGACHERILRPEVSLFVGRETQAMSITQYLRSQSQQASHEASVVLIFGAAGVGKSYLATKLVRDLRKQYPQQKWLSCLNKSGTDDIVLSALRKLSCPGAHAPSEQSDNRWLVVVDDVRLSTARDISQILSESRHSYILTTRSSSAKRLLQQTVACSQIVELCPFTNAEASELLEQKTSSKVSPEELTKACETADRKLGNLPLCVNIFASLLAAGARNKQSGELYRSVDESLSFSKWAAIEEQFGDCLHVRGLSGVLEMAKKNIEDRPLIVFALLKMVCAESESIPWNVLQVYPSWTSSGIHRYFVVDGVQDLFVNLIVVVDWLFSSRAQEILEFCRNCLEELGLIVWHKQTCTIHLHSLTLKAARTMLSDNHLFLSSFVQYVSKLPRHDVSILLTAERLSHGLLTYLLCQIVLSSVNNVRNHSAAAEDEHPASSVSNEKYLAALEFLANTIKCREVVEAERVFSSHHPGTTTLLIARSLAAYHLLISPLWHGIFDSSNLDSSHWISLYGKVPLNSEQLKYFLQVRDLTSLAAQSLFVVPDERYRSAYFGKSERLLTSMMKVKVPTSIEVAHYHCLVAGMKGLFNSANARDIHLEEASKVCKSLVCPTTYDLMECLREIWKGTSLSFANSKHYMTSCVWPKMVSFRVMRNIEVKGKVDDETKEVASLMIAVLDESQKLKVQFLKRWLQERNADCLKVGNREVDEFLSDIILASIMQVRLWHAMRKPGKSLCSAIRCIHDWNAVCKTERLKLADLSSRRTTRQYHHESLSSNLFGSVLITMQGCALLVGYNFTGDTFEKPPPSFPEICELPDHKPPMLTKKRAEPYPMGLSNIFEYHSNRIHTFRGFSTMCSTFDIQKTLHHFQCLLQSAAYLSITQTDESGPLPRPPDWILLLVPRLCALLGRHHSLQVCDELSATQRQRKSPVWSDAIDQLKRDIKYTSENSEAEKTYKLFTQAQQALKQGNNRLACTCALHCWRKVLRLRESNFLHFEVKTGVGEKLIKEFFLALANLLRQIYTAQEKYDCEKWFVLFLLDNVSTHEVYRIAQFQSFFIDFLKRKGELAAALEKARLLQHLMVDEFGEDYFERLPEAPNAAGLCSSLEKSIATSV